jgi:2-C-methyl-D-erythritol 4-phosphate cytidylyltransferase
MDEVTDHDPTDPKGNAVLLAAGLGRRLGAGMNKGFVSILNRPLLAWSLETFAKHPLVRSIVVVHTPGREAGERCRREVLEPLGLVDRVILASGGERRQDSSLRGIQALPVETLDDADSMVMIHDAARPLVSSFIITHCLRDLKKHPDAAGVLPALPIRETLKRVEDSWIRSTVDREGLWGAQTPQVFRLGRLIDAHRRAAKEGWAVTDDAGLLEAAGERLRIIPGDLENLKVTYPEDRIFAERLLHQREAG